MFARHVNGDGEPAAQAGVLRRLENLLLSAGQFDDARHLGPGKRRGGFLAGDKHRIVRKISPAVDLIGPGLGKVEEVNHVAIGLVDVDVMDQRKIVETQGLNDAFQQIAKLLHLGDSIGLANELLHIGNHTHIRLHQAHGVPRCSHIAKTSNTSLPHCLTICSRPRNRRVLSPTHGQAPARLLKHWRIMMLRREFGRNGTAVPIKSGDEQNPAHRFSAFDIGVRGSGLRQRKNVLSTMTCNVPAPTSSTSP